MGNIFISSLDEYSCPNVKMYVLFYKCGSSSSGWREGEKESLNRSCVHKCLDSGHNMD